MRIVTLLFDNITALDIVGPVEVLSWLPDVEIVHCGLRRGPVRAALTGFGLMADRTLDEVREADILIVPGGPGTRPLLANEEVLDWIRSLHAGTQWTASVCTGSLLLAAAGLLQGLAVPTHWNARAALERFGAHYVEQRVARHGKLVVAAGVSAGIDMALTLLSLVRDRAFAEAVQLGIEYDPQPPFDTGTPSKAPNSVVEQASALLQAAVAASIKA